MSELIAALFDGFNRMVPERARVQLVACTALLGLVAYIYWAGDHFARAADVSSVDRDVQSIKVNQQESGISELRAQQCHLSESSSTVKSFYAGLMAQKLEAYKRLTGNDFQLPSCSDE